MKFTNDDDCELCAHRWTEKVDHPQQGEMKVCKNHAKIIRGLDPRHIPEVNP